MKQREGQVLCECRLGNLLGGLLEIHKVDIIGYAEITRIESKVLKSLERLDLYVS
ncbi:hypothetical protein [Bartonella rattaustraliani]|uniref:hypothetical protein n=1 Tax=Bartonella rattaustraliani TaxID=481139 RepID=UPI0012EAB2B8|nr:hypothetical protein [Bartonella rattaustraliani]